MTTKTRRTKTGQKSRLISKALRFTNKTVLVTGAGQNTGMGIAASFAAEGATVFLNDRTPESVNHALIKLRKRGLRNLVGIPADISVAADVESMFRQISAQAKRLDVLVNNAAHQGIGYRFENTPLDFLESVLRVNLIGTYHVAQQAARMMLKCGGGAIVNIGSNVSTRSLHKRSAYQTSKGGIDAMTLAMAVELGPHQIRVNLVAPGYIHTDRWAVLPAAHARRRRANAPLGREATAEDVAQAVMFLASDQAANITGARLIVDGGCCAQHMPEDIDV